MGRVLDWAVSLLASSAAVDDIWLIGQWSLAAAAGSAERTNSGEGLRHMARKRASTSDRSARDAIRGAAVSLAIEKRGGPITTEMVAARARCAKGLVHYHFSTKDTLLADVAQQLWARRAEAWAAALADTDATAAIGAAWTRLRNEAADGSASACAWVGLYGGKSVGRSVNEGRDAFVDALGAALATLLARMGLRATVPVADLAALLAATAEGLGLRLADGVDETRLEQAWAAFWVGLLSLTTSRSSA